jgi:sorbitol-specific phosphotransferase system component IIBC
MLKALIVDGVMGAVVGTGIGVLAEIGLMVANVSLFIASPLLAPLAMLGWGASPGGVIGAVIGSESIGKTDGKFADLVHDAIMNGQVVLVVRTFTEAETAIAQEVIKESVGAFNDVRSL